MRKISIKGLTLIELLLVISIIAILGLISAVFFSRLILSSATVNTYNLILAEMHKAQIYAQEGKGNSGWGIYYDSVNHVVTLYQGDSFSTRTNQAVDEKTKVNANVCVAGFYTSNGAPDFDINFARKTGVPSTPVGLLSGLLPVITIRAANTQKVISLNSGGSSNSTYNFITTDDSYVDSKNPSSASPNSDFLGISGKSCDTGSYGYECYTYLKFDLTTLAGKTITSAKMRVSVNDPSAGTFVVEQTGTGWQSQTLNWNNKPAATGTIIPSLPGPGGTTCGPWDIDLTNFVNTNKGSVVSIRIRTETTTACTSLNPNVVSCDSLWIGGSGYNSCFSTSGVCLSSGTNYVVNFRPVLVVVTQ